MHDRAHTHRKCPLCAWSIITSRPPEQMDVTVERLLSHLSQAHRLSGSEAMRLAAPAAPK
jgi:hypothetical protein